MKPAVPLTLALLLVAACARDEDASVRPAESNAVERVGGNEQEEERPALGDWRRTLLEEQPALEFGTEGTQALVTLGCGADRGIVMQRPGPLASGAQANVTVTVGAQGRQLPLTMVGGSTTPSARAAVAAGDPLLGQIGNSPAPIRLGFGDGTSLVLPPSPLIGQFIQACASGVHAPIAGAAPDGNAQSAAETTPANESNAAR
jgi:hypothetical protein